MLIASLTRPLTLLGILAHLEVAKISPAVEAAAGDELAAFVTRMVNVGVSAVLQTDPLDTWWMVAFLKTRRGER